MKHLFTNILSVALISIVLTLSTCIVTFVLIQRAIYSQGYALNFNGDFYITQSGASK